MAKEYGSRLLAEVQECTLAETLEELRHRKQPTHTRWTGIQYIDELVSAFAASQTAPRTNPSTRQPGATPSITHAQGLNRNDQSPPHPPPSPPIIELTGITPSSGKTQLLYLIAAHHLLGQSPSRFPSPSSPAGTVVYLDLTSRFSAYRLLSILKSTLSTLPFTDASAADPVSAKEAHIHTAALEALAHIHVFKPQTSRSLITTLRSLRAYLLNLAAHHSGERPLTAVLIADLSAFYWQDRQDAEVERMEWSATAGGGGRGRAAAQGGQEVDLMGQRWREVVAELRELRRVFGCMVLATNMALAKVKRTKEGEVLQPHLSGAWNGLVGVRVLLERERERWAETLSAQEVLEEQKRKLNEIGENSSMKSRLKINVWRNEDWDAGMRDRVAEVEAKNKCSLHVGKEVSVESHR